jgi:hypothetical protein
MRQTSKVYDCQYDCPPILASLALIGLYTMHHHSQAKKKKALLAKAREQALQVAQK